MTHFGPDVDDWLHVLRELPIWQAAGLLLAENIAIFVLALICGQWLAHRFTTRPVAQSPAPIDNTERFLAALTVVLNSLVTLAGWWLWRQGVIVFRRDGGPAALLDFALLVIVMDFAMYVLHRMAHVAWIYRIIHQTHHKYDNPRPLTLFVMNPLECLSFGLLWLLVISLYDATWLGMSLYLAFNVAFGILGHIGVEPLPDAWKRWPVLKHISTSTFHAGHHHEGGFNFGFYSLVWDRLFGTLAPRYEEDFARRPRAVQAAPRRFRS